jgi:hypothetical protein
VVSRNSREDDKEKSKEEDDNMEEVDHVKGFDGESNNDWEDDG